MLVRGNRADGGTSHGSIAAVRRTGMSPIVRSTRTIPCVELLASTSRRTFLGGSLAGSNPSFTADAAAAKASIAKLAGLRFETLLVGHGEPIPAGASAQVAALAAAG